MKLRYFLAIPALLYCFTSFAQEQQVEQYCQLIATPKLLSHKVTIDINYGEERKLFSTKERRVKDELGKVKVFNSTVDALNYLGKLGWKLVNAYPVSTGSQNAYYYIFKREFDVADLEDEE